ncbi:PqqD family protein, partial [Elusimicrobiota bacterium]
EKFGGVLFETQKEKVFVTNPAGTKIINLIKEGKDLKQVATALKHEYDAGEGEIEKDIAEFVGNLRKEGLIKE